MQVDPQFRAGGSRARSRRRVRTAFRLATFGVVPVAGFCVGLWSLTDLPDRLRAGIGAWRIMGDADESLVQVEQEIVVAPVVVGNAFINIPGDPTILHLPSGDTGSGVVRVAGPGVLDINRFGLPQPARFAILSDDLVITQSRLMTVLPSTREEFAFLQAQQDRAAQQMRAGVADPAALAALAGLDLIAPGEGGSAETDDQDSYGSEIAGLEARDEAAPADAVAVERTSISYTRSETSRQSLFEDVVLRAEQDRTLADLLAESPLAGTAAAVAAEVETVIAGSADIPRGGIVALRVRPAGDDMTLSHISVYGVDGYIGTAARGGTLGTGPLVAAVDPWVGSALMAQVNGEVPEAGATFRLLDAIYSAALRGGVASDLAGTFTGLLSQDLDLESAAREGDRITLVYVDAHGPSGTAEGQLMYAALDGPSGSWACYVVPDAQDGGYRCFVPGRASGGGAAMTIPVEGVMTSRFGPRNHPIRNVVRLHAGVDWAAPTGTPIVAAMAGQIARRGVAGGYGNLIAVAHAGGTETRYAHMSAFEPGLDVGDPVQAGQVIGYVGTTGASTGPHLHFEVRQDGTPTDPLPFLTGERVLVAAADAGVIGAGASGAVEALVSQIIRVESGGNARAQNPLSSAAGLGQFIDSTWLRMMQTYRPDLTATLSRADLLALKFDPTLSREMVTRLAQENERYLVARGHSITAGRLYLAHFLGPGGADTVLSASEGQTIAVLMGAGVVRANPFLANYTVADLRAWAERKMSSGGAGAPPVVAPPPPPDPAVQLYVELVGMVLAEGG